MELIWNQTMTYCHYYETIIADKLETDMKLNEDVYTTYTEIADTENQTLMWTVDLNYYEIKRCRMLYNWND